MHIHCSTHVSMRATVAFCCALLLSAAFVSCSDSNDDTNNSNNSNSNSNNGNTDDPALKVDFDDLSFFQNSIIAIDENGNVKGQYVGEALYENDPLHLYIGVETFSEAEAMFRQWIAPDVELGVVAPLTANLTDSLGRPQGSVTFAKGTESGHVAEVTASAETKLQKFNKITFLLNSAWPFNGSNPIHFVSDIIVAPLNTFDNSGLNDDDKVLQWVCIREERNGQKPIFITITKHTYSMKQIGGIKHDNIRESPFLPGLERARAISNILKSDWNYYCSLFDGINCGQLRKDGFWIDQTHGILPYYNDYMYYASGATYGASRTKWGSDWEVGMPYLFKIDWMSDAEITAMLFPTAGTNIPGHHETYSNLFDNSIHTKWYVQESCKQDGVWFVEFHANDASKVKGYTLYTADDAQKYPQRNPVAWKFKAKLEEGDEWVLLDERDTEKNTADALPATNGTAKTYSFKNTNQYRFFRFEVSKTKGTDMQLSRFVFAY